MQNYGMTQPTFNWGQAGLQAGGSILDALGGMLYNPENKWRKWKRGMLLGELGRPAITNQQVQSFLPQMQQSVMSGLNPVAQQASQRVGLDSGAAWGEIMKEGQGMYANLLNNLRLRQLIENAQKRQGIMGMLAGV